MENLGQGEEYWSNLTPQEKAKILTRIHQEQVHNEEAEQLLLGVILTDNFQLHKVHDLSEDDFYIPQHKWIFAHMKKEILAGRMVSPVTMKHMVDGADDVENGYLMIVAGMASTILNARDISRVIKDLSNRRKLSRMLDDARDVLGDTKNGKHSSEIIADIYSDLMTIPEQEDEVQVKTERQVTKEIIDDLEHSDPCIGTGIKLLDTCMGGGAYPRRSYCIAARQKQGKTVLLATIWYNMRMQGNKVMYICAEMGEKEIHQRNIARSIKKNSQAFYSQRTKKEFVDALIGYQQSQSNDGLFVDAAGIRLDQMIRAVEVGVHKYGIKGFFLDYVGLVTGHQRGENDAKFIERVCNEIAKLCKRHNIFCVYAAQINRDGDLRGSDGPKNAADQLYFLHKKEGTVYAWMEQDASRYTPELHVGTEENPGLEFDYSGPHFKSVEGEIPDDGKAIYSMNS